MYIHEHPNWPNFTWEESKARPLIDEAIQLQANLYGRLASFSFDDKVKSTSENMAASLIESAEIEGQKLNADLVRSSVARRLGLEYKAVAGESHYIEGLVEVSMDATQHYDGPLTKERLCGWQTAFFPMGMSGPARIEVGKYRTHEEIVVSGFMGREKVHYRAPGPERIEFEMKNFLEWCNRQSEISPMIKSAISHFWFLAIHPFEDGNGRLARIIGDVFLARSINSPFRYFNLSTWINRDKRHYYEILESAQKGSGDITAWMIWYFRTLIKSLKEAQSTVSQVLNKAFFWQNASGIALSQRQVNTLNHFLDGYEAKITSKSWCDFNKCSKDTAIRDIQDLIQKGLLLIDIPDAKRPSYSICYNRDYKDLLARILNPCIIHKDDDYYLTGLFQGETIEEKISPLDGDRYSRNDLPLTHILQKYCSYLLWR